MLKHADIWRAIDRLAEKNGLTPSALARMAGLCSTTFNVSKRIQNGRKRWPSTESIAAILEATHTDIETFISMIKNEIPIPSSLPLYTLSALLKDHESPSDKRGKKSAAPVDRIPHPGRTDPHAFMVEITNNAYRPLYREGDQILVSPAAQMRRGDRVIVKTLGKELLIRQLGLDGAQKVELLPLTPDDSPLTLSRKEIDWLHRITFSS